MFKEGDPFSVNNVPKPRKGKGPSTDPALDRAPATQPVPGPSNPRSSRSVITAPGPEPSASAPPRFIEKSMRSVPSKGWFVTWNAVIPGVYHGMYVIPSYSLDIS